MSQYLLHISYTPEAWAALIRNPQDRGEAVRGAIEKLGGKLERIWLAFGDEDIIAVTELPDNIAAAGIAMAFSAGGACKHVKTTPLLSMREGIEAMKKASQCGYKPVHQSA